MPHLLVVEGVGLYFAYVINLLVYNFAIDRYLWRDINIIITGSIGLSGGTDVYGSLCVRPPFPLYISWMKEIFTTGTEDRH